QCKQQSACAYYQEYTASACQMGAGAVLNSQCIVCDGCVFVKDQDLAYSSICTFFLYYPGINAYALT
ncbi:MAG: hypothetical protein EZS28_035698, partial [Streblomastix strix]